jgi:hypothetical protein
MHSEFHAQEVISDNVLFQKSNFHYTKFRDQSKSVFAINEKLGFDDERVVDLSYNEYIVVAQLNLWYFGEGCYGGFEDYDCDGNSVVSVTPLQGLYYSSDSDVIKNQINWAVDYGVDAFSIEWVSPRYQPGSLEKNMDEHFLTSPYINKIRWCIFYDFNLRLNWAGYDITDGINFDNLAIADTLLSDFIYFGKKYFNHPQYLYVDGRPLIYIWNAYFDGAFENVLKQARDSLLKMGYDIFVAGDVISGDYFNPSYVSLFDANTTFTMLIGGTPPFENMAAAAEGVDDVFQFWKSNIKDLKVKNRNENVILQPAWSPQYKDSLFILNNNMGEPTYIPAENKDQVIRMAEVARSYASPMGKEAEKIVWLNTFNNWAETTTIEPTIASGPKYPAGNYQFDFLEVVKEVFGEVTFWGNCDQIFSDTSNVYICDNELPFTWGNQLLATKGVYIDTVLSVNGCDSIIAINLMVNESPNPNITVNNDTLIAVESYTSYQWYDQDGIIIGATSSQYIIEQSDTYYLEVTNENGCSKMSDGVNVTKTGINKLSNSPLKLIVNPNPNDGRFTLKLENARQGNYLVQILNELGQLKFEKEGYSVGGIYFEEFVVSHLPKGNYFVQVSDGETFNTQKIILQ